MKNTNPDVVLSSIFDDEAFHHIVATVFASADDGIMITDGDGVIIYTNPAFTEITGYEQSEAIGQKPALLRSHLHGRPFYDALWNSLTSTGQWRGSIWNRRKSGESYLQYLKINAIRSAFGTAVYYVATFSDLTEMPGKADWIRELAQHDPLTGLPNRFLLMDRLGQSIAAATREQKKVGLLFIDIDRFKAINEGLGHAVGDEALQVIGQRLRKSVRAMDTVARSGGDEFMVVLGGLGETGDCAIVAEALAVTIASDVAVGDNVIRLTASIGIAVFPDDGDSAEELLKNADAAMYAAKAAGRGTHRFFLPAQTKRVSDELRLEMDLRAAVENDELELYYQPQVSLADQRLHGFEALLRWRHPSLGMIPPAEFIPVAENIGVIDEIGLWVLRQACRQMAQWREQGCPAVTVAINVAASQLRDEHFLDALEREICVHGLPPSALHVELTESMLMHDPEHAAETLRRMQRIGVKIAVDDFGTGYSSLAYLRTLPIDVLKIDRSFVKNIEFEESTAKIVRMIVNLAKTLGMVVVSEGVENQAQADFLHSVGCHVAQGYLYSPPAPAPTIAGTWLLPSRRHLLV